VKQTPAKRPSVADERQPVVDPLANVQIPCKKRATESVAAPPPNGKAADKALNVAEHAMKRAPATATEYDRINRRAMHQSRFGWGPKRTPEQAIEFTGIRLAKLMLI
jgi:hypothetical protein